MQKTRIETDETLRETITPQYRNFSFSYCYENVFEFERGCIAWHWHDEVELVTVERGEMVCDAGRHSVTLRAGEGVFINAGVIHRFTAKADAIIPNVEFLPAALFPCAAPDALTEEPYAFLALRPDVPWQKEALALLDSVYARSRQRSPAWMLRVLSPLAELWALLCEHRADCETDDARGGDRLASARLKRMMAFIEAHEAEKISLADIAASANVSVSEALRCFRLELHDSPMRYLNGCRLRRAAGLLRAGGLSVTEIAAACGFEQTGYFDRLFRRAWGVSPREYRKAKRPADVCPQAAHSEKT